MKAISKISKSDFSQNETSGIKFLCVTVPLLPVSSPENSIQI